LKTSNNNKIDAAESDYLYIRLSQLPDSGNGLFTAINIYKDETIAVFKGEILTDTEAKLRVKKDNDKYFINLLDGSIMDSMNVKCFAKYANDANGFANSTFKNNSKIALNDDSNVSIIATRNIKTGEELFCSYGKRYWKKHS
jgi:uncharacterized protein